MTKQLHLIDSDTGIVWPLDDATRSVGRKGLANARQALRASRPFLSPDNQTNPLSDVA